MRPNIFKKKGDFMKKKIFIVLAALCSFHSYADECQEQKFIGRLDYQETQKERQNAQSKFMGDSTHYEAQVFRDNLERFETDSD